MTTTFPDRSDAGEDLTVRRAEEVDLLAVYRIETASFPQPWPYASFERFLGEPGFLVAVESGAVVGYVVGDVTANYARDVGHVKDLAVHPDARRRGVGRRLLTAAIVNLAMAGADAVKLEVRVDNEAAISLYEAFGFEAVRVIPEYYDDGEPAQVMVLDVREWERRGGGT